MKPIKRSYTTPLRKKIRKSFSQKSDDLLVNTKTKKSSTDKFSSRYFSKKHKKKKAPPEHSCGKDTEQEMAVINDNCCNPVTALRLTNMKFIVLDSLDVESNGHRKIKRTVYNIKSNCNKISNRKKCHIIKKQTISQPLALSGISKPKKKKLDKSGLQTTTQEVTFHCENLTNKNSMQRQKAAGDSEKKEKNLLKKKNENNAERTQDKEPIIEKQRKYTMSTYENISNTFLDICLPFTFARQIPVEDDVSKVDGKFIRSLMKIARSRGLVKTRKMKISKSKTKHNQVEGDNENIFSQDLLQRSNSERKNKKSKDKSKKRLHQVQNIFFAPQSEGENKTDNSFYEHKKARDDNQAFIIRKIKLQNLNFKNSKPNEIQLTQIKSETFRIKMTTKQDDKHQKSRSVNNRGKEGDAKESSLDDEDVNITEIWRNELRVASDNSLSIHSNSSTDQKKNDYPADYEMKSYKALVKIVGEEVQRICKRRQVLNEKTENEESSKIDESSGITNATEPVNPTTKLKKPSETLITEHELKSNSKDSISVLNSQQKPTVPASENLNKTFYKEKNEEPLYSENLLQKKEDKLNELKTKLNFLAEETHDSGKIQSEILKNWSVIRRLEKAFLALGTPGFPNKTTKNLANTILQGTPRDSDLRKFYSPDKIDRTKTKSNYYCDEIQTKSQIPVFSSVKYDGTSNKRGCEQFSKLERATDGGKKLVRDEDFGKSDIYFLSFEPTGRRKSSAKAWLEGLDKKKLDRIATMENEFLGKSNNAISNKKRATDGEKEIQALGHWAKSGNEADKNWPKTTKKFKNYVFETEIEVKPTQHVFEKHSTYTILPPLTQTDSEYFLNGSSSRTYIIDPEEEEENDRSALLERKKTFAVLSTKNRVAVKPAINAKDHAIKTKNILSKSTFDLKSNSSKASIKPPLNPKSENQTRKNEEQDKKIGKSNLNFIRKNYLKMKRNKQKRYPNQEDREIAIPWDDGINNLQHSKTSVLNIQKSDNASSPRVRLRHKNKAFESYATTPVDSQIEPLMVLIHQNLEQPSSYHHRIYDSFISTETYNVLGGTNQLESRSSPKMGFPETQTISSTTPIKGKAARNVGDVQKTKRKSERCHWEEDIKQYREIVKDIISQYQRTHDFLKQSQQASRFRRTRDPENDSETEIRDRHFAGQASNIAEYRKKIITEYNAMPLVDYKSRFHKEESGRPSRRGESLGARNLYVAKNMTEDVDFDVKDYQPNVHKILDSQMYVDVNKIGRRAKANGKELEKAISLQTFVRDNRSRGKPPKKQNEDKTEESRKSSRKLENEILPVNSRLQKVPEKKNAPIEWITIKALNSISNENGESRPFACFKS